MICWLPTLVCDAVSEAALKVSGNCFVLINFGITGAGTNFFGAKIFALSADIVMTVFLSIRTIFKMYVPGSAKVIGVVVNQVPVNGWRPRYSQAPLISMKPTASIWADAETEA